MKSKSYQELEGLRKQLLPIYASGISIKQLAEETRISKNKIAIAFQTNQLEYLNASVEYLKNKITVKGGVKLFLEVFKQFKGGKSVAEIAIERKVSTTTIRNILNYDSTLLIKTKKELKRKRQNFQYAEFIKHIENMGRIPTYQEVKESKIISHAVYYNFRRKAEKEGYKFVRRYQPKPYKYTKEDMINHLKELAVKYNRAPTTKEINKEAKIYVVYYYKVFGSLQNAHKLAGLTPYGRGNSIELSKQKGTHLSKEEAMEILKNIYEKLGRKPNNKELHKYSKYYFYKFYQVLGAVDFSQLKLNDEYNSWFNDFTKRNPMWRKRIFLKEDK